MSFESSDLEGQQLRRSFYNKSKFLSEKNKVGFTFTTFATPMHQNATAVVSWGFRRLLVLLMAVLLISFLALHGTQALKTSSFQSKQPRDTLTLDKSTVLNYNTSQPSFHSQLKADTRYITQIAYGGFANQFIQIYNMLYMGKLLHRVSIIPTLMPLHFPAEPAPLSRFFDLDRFYAESGIQAVEFIDVTPIGSTRKTPEDISCWSVHHESTGGGPNTDQRSMAAHGLFANYWPLPNFLRGAEGWPLWFQSFYFFDFNSESRNNWIHRVRKERLPHVGERSYNVDNSLLTSKELSKKHHHEFDLEMPPPTDQLWCFDTLLFVGGYQPPEVIKNPSITPYIPRTYEVEGWIEAGQYLYFTPELERIADYYITKLFNVKDMSQVPPFITVHIRRGDFKEARGLTSFEAYLEAVEEVREKLQERIDNPNGWMGPGRDKQVYFKGFQAKDYAVVVATDEKPESEFVQKLWAKGWYVLNHKKMKTEESFGEDFGPWYPAMLDQVILARGRGFVGTEWSTYSSVSGLRVKYWHGGVEVFTKSLQ